MTARLWHADQHVALNSQGEKPTLRALKDQVAAIKKRAGAGAKVKTARINAPVTPGKGTRATGSSNQRSGSSTKRRKIMLSDDGEEEEDEGSDDDVLGYANSSRRKSIPRRTKIARKSYALVEEGVEDEDEGEDKIQVSGSHGVGQGSIAAFHHADSNTLSDHQAFTIDSFNLGRQHFDHGSDRGVGQPSSNLIASLSGVELGTARSSQLGATDHVVTTNLARSEGATNVERNSGTRASRIVTRTPSSRRTPLAPAHNVRRVSGNSDRESGDESDVSQYTGDF